MMRCGRRGVLLTMLGAAGLALALGGCAASDPSSANTVTPKPAANASSTPKVQDCAIVTLSTPTLYACHAKVYTEYQLQHLREQALAAKTSQ